MRTNTTYVIQNTKLHETATGNKQPFSLEENNMLREESEQQGVSRQGECKRKERNKTK